MMYETVRYGSREDALSAFKKMMQRKREWVENTQRELDEIILMKHVAV